MSMLMFAAFLACAPGSDVLEADPDRQHFEEPVEPGSFSIGCSDESCEFLVAEVVVDPGEESMAWFVDGVFQSDAPELVFEVATEDWVQVELRVENPEGQLSQMQHLLRSRYTPLPGEEYNSPGPGYEVVAEPVRQPNVVTLCEGRSYTLGLIGGCFRAVGGLKVHLSQRPTPPQHASHWLLPAKYSSWSQRVTRGDWNGARATVGGMSVRDGQVSQPASPAGDSFQVEGSASAGPSWSVIEGSGAVHTNVVGVACEDEQLNVFKVDVSGVAGWENTK